MKLKAYAKVNLGLKVFKRNNETKHRVDSILYLCNNLYDSIEIQKSKKCTISYFYKHHKISVEECLISKVLNYLHEKFDLNINYQIRVDKRIPIGAGLGGGSSDAATVINYLIRGKKINLDLQDIAIQLGSDIPFFLSKYQIARVKNFGEHVSPIYDWEPKIKLHINNVFASTEKIFDLLDKDPFYKSQVNIDTIIKNHIYKQHNNVVYNDLTKYIIQSDKQLEKIFSEFKDYGWFTGAGSTIVTLED